MKNFNSYISEGLSRGSTAVTITFGRFNPVTIGHEKLAKKLASVAKSNKSVPIIFTSTSHDSIKNPLNFWQKIELLTKAFPNVEVSKDASLKTMFHILAELSNEGVTDLTLVVGGDRVKEFDTLLNKYNNAGRGNFQYNFDNIKVVSAGARDPDANDVSGMSASKMRELAEFNKLKEFKKGLPKRLQSDAEKIMGWVRTGMKL